MSFRSASWTLWIPPEAPGQVREAGESREVHAEKDQNWCQPSETPRHVFVHLFLDVMCFFCVILFVQSGHVCLFGCDVRSFFLCYFWLF